jgi:hypothetical protein
MIPCSQPEQGIRVIEQGIHLRKHGILQFCLAHLAVQYRWFCFAKTTQPAPISLGRGAVRKTVGFFAFE